VATRQRQHDGGGVTVAGIDTDNNQLKAVVEAAGAEILVAMATATTTATVTDGDSGNDDNVKNSVHYGGDGNSNGRGHRQQLTT
jgi:hypothetical protein